MKIANAKIHNQSIHVDNINMEFDSIGLYRIEGENGCGKTTLLEMMLFGNDAEFSSGDEKNMYQKERYRLFSYCPQKIVANHLKVEQYITKGNSAVDRNYMFKLLHIFGFEDSILNQRFDNLSGGEQMKVSLVSGLIRNTPYLFLDEPSNYLDDASTAVLNEVLKFESERRCVIFVSHDERMNISAAKRYSFAGGTVTYRENEKEKESEQNKKKASLDKGTICASGMERGKLSTPNMIRLMKYYAKNFAFFFALSCVVILSVLMLFQTEKDMRTELGECDYPADGYIIVQKSGYHDELNIIYEKERGLKVPSECRERYVRIEDIPQLARIDGVKDIFIWTDNSYLYKIDEKIAGLMLFPPNPSFVYRPKEEICAVAFPQEVLKNSGRTEFYLKLLAGRPPRDNAGEITASVELLTQCFGYSEKTIEEAMGQKISIRLPGQEKAREYLIVGIMALPYEMVSYEADLGLGSYWYDADDYDVFCKSEKETFLACGFEEEFFPDSYNEVIMRTDDDKMSKVTDYLYTHFPYSVHCSAYSCKIQESAIVRNCGLKELVKHLITAVVIFGLSFVLCRNSIRYNIGMLWEIGNYYLNRKKIYGQYLMLLLCTVSIIFLTLLGINAFRTHFLLWTSTYIILYWMAALFAVIVSTLWGRRRAVKEYGIEI